MANLVELFDNIVQMQNLNGVPLAAGKLYVYALGRTRLMDSWSDVDGESLNPNPIILDDAGQAHVYVSDDFDYTLVVCDQYNNEIFSLDKYLYSKGSHSHADVAVAPSESIAVSSYHVGETTVYVPYLTGQLGKVYEGIDPIVVNNQVDKISANHVPLGVQDPLYFVQDDEEGCIIGCSAQTEIPSALSSKWDEASDAVIANSAQWAEGTEYEAGSYVDINGHTISVTGLSPLPADTASTGLVASVSADITAMIPDTSDMATQTWVNEQGFLTAHQDISNKLDTTAFSTVSGDFLTAIPSEYVTENTLQSGLSSKLDSTAFSTVSGDFLTAHQSLDGLMSADLLEISDNKITGYNGTAFAGQGGVTGDFTLVEGNGIQLTDDPIAQTTTISVSGDYATQEDIESATSGLFPTTAVTPMVNNIMGSVTGSTITYSNKPSAEAIYATNNLLYNVNYIVGSGININSSYLWLGGIVTATTGGITASGLSAGYNGSFAIQSVGELFLSEYEHGFIFSSVNTGLGTAKLTTANPNSKVTIFSPKFEAKNISGAGFSIEGSGAKGYDQNGNVTWDTTKPAKLIGWSNYQGTAIDPRASGINGNIIATVYPDQIPTSMAISSAPYSYMNGYGIYACNPDGTKLSVDVNSRSISLIYPGMSATAAMNPGDIQYNKYNTATSATDIWSLTGSVQKREIECDTATSAITAIAGSAIGGGGGSVDFDYDSDGNISGINSSAIRYPSAEQLLPYPMEYVANISDATGANILYVVTGE